MIFGFFMHRCSLSCAVLSNWHLLTHMDFKYQPVFTKVDCCLITISSHFVSCNYFFYELEVPLPTLVGRALLDSACLTRFTAWSRAMLLFYRGSSSYFLLPQRAILAMLGYGSGFQIVNCAHLHGRFCKLEHLYCWGDSSHISACLGAQFSAMLEPLGVFSPIRSVLHECYILCLCT
jgi:hypothetical protein